MIDLTKFLELLDKWLARRTEYYERQMKSIYEQIIDEILRVIGEIYRKYEKDGRLSRTDMQRYKRVDKLQRDLQLSIDKLSKCKQKTLTKALNESYEYSYDWMSWAIEKETMVPLKQPKPEVELPKTETDIVSDVELDDITPDKPADDTDIDADVPKPSKVPNQAELMKLAIEQKALENPVTGLTLNETLEKHRVDVIQKVRTEVRRGVANGSTYKQMADGLSKTLEDDYVKAVRVVRTETHRVREQAVLESAQNANSQGIVMAKKWLSMKDERVRRGPKASHVAMHGQVVPVDDFFDLGNGERAQAPSMSGLPHHDINCRCITTYTVEDIKAQTDKQLAQRTFEQYQQLKSERESS